MRCLQLLWGQKNIDGNWLKGKFNFQISFLVPRQCPTENLVFFPWEFNSFRRKDNSDDSWIGAILCYFLSAKKHENSVFWILWSGTGSRLHWKCKCQGNPNSCEGFCRHISEQDLSFIGFLRNQTSKQQEKIQLPNIFIKIFSMTLILYYWEFFFAKWNMEHQTSQFLW